MVYQMRRIKYDILIDHDMEFSAAVMDEYMINHTYLVIEEFEVSED